MHWFINKPSRSLTGNQTLGHFTVFDSEVQRLFPFILAIQLFLNLLRQVHRMEKNEGVGAMTESVAAV